MRHGGFFGCQLITDLFQRGEPRMGAEYGPGARCQAFCTDREQRKAWGVGVLYLLSCPLLLLMLLVGALKVRCWCSSNLWIFLHSRPRLQTPWRTQSVQWNPGCHGCWYVRETGFRFVDGKEPCQLGGAVFPATLQVFGGAGVGVLLLLRFGVGRCSRTIKEKQVRLEMKMFPD